MVMALGSGRRVGGEEGGGSRGEDRVATSTTADGLGAMMSGVRGGIPKVGLPESADGANL